MQFPSGCFFCNVLDVIHSCVESSQSDLLCSYACWRALQQGKASRLVMEIFETFQIPTGNGRSVVFPLDELVRLVCVLPKYSGAI